MCVFVCVRSATFRGRSNALLLPTIKVGMSLDRVILKILTAVEVCMDVSVFVKVHLFSFSSVTLAIDKFKHPVRFDKTQESIQCAKNLSLVFQPPRDIRSAPTANTISYDGAQAENFHLSVTV